MHYAGLKFIQGSHSDLYKRMFRGSNRSLKFYFTIYFLSYNEICIKKS